MKLRFAVVVMLSVSILFLAQARVAYAQWPAIDSGYGVTTDWHGEEVPMGEEVTAFAGTTDSEVTHVEFRWLNPAGDEIWDVNVTISTTSYITPEVPGGVPPEIVDWANDNPGIEVWYANNAQTPEILGDWGVQALFHDYYDPQKSLRGKNSDIVAIRATSFNAVPEVPFGTIAILLSMFGALAIFAIRKKYNST